MGKRSRLLFRVFLTLGVLACGPCPSGQAATLKGLRCEMPCKRGHRGEVCRAADPRPTQTVVMEGRPGQLYRVTLRFRGVVEQHSYAGGKQDRLWYVGGHSAQGSYNIYRLHISDPEQTYYLNAGRAGIRRTWAIDYTKTLRVRGGATVTLSGDAQDGALIVNRDESNHPIIIPGVPPAPELFDGQFIQMDVTSVTSVESANQ